MPTPLPDFQSDDTDTQTGSFSVMSLLLCQGYVHNIESSKAGRLLGQAEVT